MNHNCGPLIGGHLGQYEQRYGDLNGRLEVGRGVKSYLDPWLSSRLIRVLFRRAKGSWNRTSGIPKGPIWSMRNMEHVPVHAKPCTVKPVFWGDAPKDGSGFAQAFGRANRSVS